MDDLLCGMYSSVEDRVESAAVLAQITSPWISDNHKIHNLDLHVMSMVSALTGKINRSRFGPTRSKKTLFWTHPVLSVYIRFWTRI